MSKVNYQHSVCKDQTVPLLLGSKADKCLDLPLSFASIHLRDWGQPMGLGLGFTRFDFWWGWATMCGGDFGQHNWWIGISLARKESWKSPIKSHAKQSQFYDKRETFFFLSDEDGRLPWKDVGLPLPPYPWRRGDDEFSFLTLDAHQSHKYVLHMEEIIALLLKMLNLWRNVELVEATNLLKWKA